MKSTRPGARILGRPVLAYVMALVIGLSLILPGAAMAQSIAPPQYSQPMYGEPMYGEPMYGEPMYGEPMYGEPMYGQPMGDPGMSGRAIYVDDTPMYQGGQYYYVRPGDTLSEIALRFGTTMEALMRANGIRNPNHIYVGQQLVIPGGSGGTGGKLCQKEHVVRRGETLSGIAQRYMVDPYDLMRENGISNPNRIYAGQVLCIPTGQGPMPMPPSVPVQPVQPMPPMKPVQPVQPVQPMPPVKPVQPVQPGMPPSQPPKPVEPPKVVQPMPPYDPCQPNQPCQPPMPPAQPCQPNQPDCRPPHDREMDHWKGSYFKDKYFSEFVEERKDAEVRFNWYKEAPFEGMPKDRFSVRWERAVYFDGGDYRFYATADDGVRVIVGDTTVIDGWKIQPATEYKGDISLPRGIQWVVVEYYEEAEDAQISVHWEQRHQRHH